jgi:succinate dehydrogenase/fumarate reductase flavoprotein subunit
MKTKRVTIDEREVVVIDTDVAVVGSGAAALNAAVHLWRFGVKNIVIVTEELGGGTSANAGSDKQTYYRLNPGDASGDSIYATAHDLFAGGCMHGDIALIEAAASLREFYHLVELGVPFPEDRFGDFIGYKTDHDSKSRGTSAGPKTSIMMYQMLLDEVRRFDIPIIDRTRVIDLITAPANSGKKVAGLLALNLDELESDHYGLVTIHAAYVVYATGGPAALYEDSVYPPSQAGSLGVALMAGAVAQNLTESQFGIGSVGFRWNLSGSFQQVIPRYISTDSDGRDEAEFLNDSFPTLADLLTAQFLKGYQWPFDVRKVADFGSSLIDLLIFYETKIKGRRVFLDYTKNPVFRGREFSPKTAPGVVREYLEKSGAAGKNPTERLMGMNRPAYELYRERGIDLAADSLEIRVCHQHTNGGLVGDIWWESNIRNFFPVGEVNGSHGIYRPGGSALNAGQVGSLRAAMMISHRIRNGEMGDTKKNVLEKAARRLAFFDSLVSADRRIDPAEERGMIQGRMSRVMGVIRNSDDIESALNENLKMMEEHRSSGVGNRDLIPSFLRNEDLLVTEHAHLISARTLLQGLAGSRGSFLAGNPDEIFRNRAGGGTFDFSGIAVDESKNDHVIECVLDKGGEYKTRWTPVRPIPASGGWFEAVWADFRAGKIYEYQEGENDEKGSGDK